MNAACGLFSMYTDEFTLPSHKCPMIHLLQRSPANWRVKCCPNCTTGSFCAYFKTISDLSTLRGMFCLLSSMPLLWPSIICKGCVAIWTCWWRCWSFHLDDSFVIIFVFPNLLTVSCSAWTVNTSQKCVCTLGWGKTNFEKSQSPPVFSGP